jgi:hypothetical protein
MNPFKLAGIGLIGGLFAASCATIATNAKKPTVGSDFTFTSRFDDDESRVWVSIHSLAKRPLCQSRVDWPNDGGRIGGGDTAIVSDSVEHRLVSDFNYGTCIGDGCFIRIEPGQSLQGYISYSEFAAPNLIKALPNKALVRFSPRPTFCRVHNTSH